MTQETQHKGIIFSLVHLIFFRKQRINKKTSRSSLEAKYEALGSTTSELICLIYILKDLHITCSKPHVLYCDNQSTLHIASKHVLNEITKHLEINCHLVREKVQQGRLKLLHISSHEQLANFLPNLCIQSSSMILYPSLTC